MREALQDRCSLIIQNRDRIKSSFAWEDTYLYPLCAALCTVQNKIADIEAMRSSRELLKAKTGLFSSFRGTSKMATITMLSLSENPADKMDRMLFVYGKLRELFWASDYLTVAAAVIADMAQPSEYERIVSRTKTIYNRMKNAHPFLTSGEDSAFAALLALSGLDDVHIEQEMEKCYALLKPSFFSGNAVQSLSHVLSLGEAPAEQKCAKALGIFERLKSQGYKYGTNYELSTLGTLSLLDTDIDSIAQDMMDADNYLKTQKGFGAFGIGAKQRLMYAGMLAMCDYMPNITAIQTAALNSVVSLVIAQQAAICASVAAASAAAAASSSSSS